MHSRKKLLTYWVSWVISPNWESQLSDQNFKAEKNWKRFKKWIEVKIKNQYYNLKIMFSHSSKSWTEANLTTSNRVLNNDPKVAKTIRRFKKSREITLLKKLKLVSRMKAHPGLYSLSNNFNHQIDQSDLSLFFMECTTKVGWLLQDSWQNSTPRIHHVFIHFFVPFVLHNLRFWLLLG